MATSAPTSTFPFPIREISNKDIKLIRFSPEKHMPTFYNLSSNHPELFSHIPAGPWPDVASFSALFITGRFSEPTCFAFGIIDKTRPASAEDPEGELAGTISLIKTSAVHLCTEIGFIVILPQYQHTHVAKTSVGLLMQYTLDPVERGGIGLCRVDWLASTMNPASIGLAERMGFVKNGVIPWHMRFVKGKLNGKVGHGRQVPAGWDQEDLWRDSCMLSLAWDQWEGGARERVLEIIGD